SPFVLALLALGAGCQAEPPAPGAARLQASFPTHASEILGGEDRFSCTAAGFEPVRFGEAPLRAVLPRRGEDSFRLETGSGFAVAVRETGAWGDARLEGAAAVFERPGGSSFWRFLGARGVEEWLLLGPERREGPAASWEVSGGALVERGDAVEVVDQA